MYTRDDSNKIFNLAADMVNHTGKHVFITGKAGTGKTTFLKYIREQTKKNTVVVAPTGVAAINAGGVTMHSFFQLPFNAFVPVVLDRNTQHLEATDKHSLFRNIRFAATRRELFQEMELLIIDEVSMVRCDMLDAMDTILRHFRKKPLLPFGGVQVVYIGDMFQLPPVVPQHEWEILKNYYASPYFFDSRVVKESPPLYIELKKIYRQNEQEFIDILNRVRNNQPQRVDFEVLNSRYQPQFAPADHDSFITLTTHNRKAEIINEAALHKLPGSVHVFKAEISGEFSDKSLPTELDLQLKEGAQVMFIKNDTGEQRRFYNGKIAHIKKIMNDEIFVALEPNGEELKLEKETWKNIRYNYNKEEARIEEEELGSFRQYPVRLAWAITIHKSQGLTFEKAVIDAGASFAAGQVYVALSRCTSLQGMILHSRIHASSISTDPRILEFSKAEANDDDLEVLLTEEKIRYQQDQLQKAFGWDRVIRALREWREILEAKKIPDPESVLSLNKLMMEKAIEQSRIAEKFSSQLTSVFNTGDLDLLEERVNKAILYFSRFLVEHLVTPLQQHMDDLKYVSRVKKYLQQAGSILAVFKDYIHRLNQLEYGSISFLNYQLPAPAPASIPAMKKSKPEKGASHRESLALFLEGKSIDEIAALRHLARTTVEGHLAGFVFSGELHINQLVDPARTEKILSVIAGTGPYASTIRNMLGAEYSFGEIRAVLNHYRALQEVKNEA